MAHVKLLQLTGQRILMKGRIAGDFYVLLMRIED